MNCLKNFSLKFWGLCLTVLAPLCFWIGFGDTWNDPKILLLILGSSIFYFAPGEDSFTLSKRKILLSFLLATVLLSILIPIFSGQATLGSRSLFSFLGVALAGLGLIRTPQLKSLEIYFLQRLMLCVPLILSFWVILSHSGVLTFQNSSLDLWNLKWKATTSFGNPNRTAEFLGFALWLIPSFVASFSFTPKMRNRLTGIFITLTLASIILCFSRSALLSLCLTGAVVACLNTQWKPLITILLAAATLCFFVIFISDATFSEWLKPVLNEKSIQGRFNEYSFLITYLSEHYLFFTGMGMEPTAPGSQLIRPPFYHSDVLGFWIEAGLIGLISGLTFVVILLTESPILNARNKISPLHSSFLFLSFQSLYQFPLRDPGLLAWIFLVLLIQKSQFQNSPERQAG